MPHSDVLLLKDAVVIDGLLTINVIMAALQTMTEYITREGLDISDYALVCSYENIGGIITYFEGEKFLAYTEAEGLCYSISNRTRSEIIYLKDLTPNWQNDWSWGILHEVILPVLGFNAKIGRDIYFESYNREFGKDDPTLNR